MPEAVLPTCLRGLLTGLLVLSPVAQAAVRLSNDWPSGFAADGHLLPKEQDESSHLRLVAEKLAEELRATAGGTRGRPIFDMNFKLFVDDVKYYIAPVMFMPRTQPGETCTPKDYVNIPTYQCEEGQRLTSEPHILFFNDKFQPEGAYQLVLKSPYKHFCNAMLAMGVADKARNELLVTVQCFDVDRAVANKRTSVGATWKRSTVLFRVKAAEGKLLLEQDDSCLGNPNDIESIPEARKRLKKCSASSK